MKTHWKISVALTLLMSYWTTAFAGQYVRVSADLELYYDEAGLRQTFDIS